MVNAWFCGGRRNVVDYSSICIYLVPRRYCVFFLPWICNMVGREMHGWIFMYVTVATGCWSPLFLFAVSSLECCLTLVCSVTEKEKRKEWSLWRIALLWYDLFWTWAPSAYSMYSLLLFRMLWGGQCSLYCRLKWLSWLQNAGRLSWSLNCSRRS